MERIYLIGFMGSGKTTMGQKLAKALGYTFLDMDHRIENKYHKSVTQIFEEFGQDEFRKMEQGCLHEVSQFEKVVIATGGGAACYFDNMDVMNSTGYTVYIKMSAEELAVRLELMRDGKRPLVANKTGEELRQYISDTLLNREPYYNQAAIYVHGEIDEMVNQILEKVKQS